MACEHTGATAVRWNNSGLGASGSAYFGRQDRAPGRRHGHHQGLSARGHGATPGNAQGEDYSSAPQECAALRCLLLQDRAPGRRYGHHQGLFARGHGATPGNARGEDYSSATQECAALRCLLLFNHIHCRCSGSANKLYSGLGWYCRFSGGFRGPEPSARCLDGVFHSI